MDLPVLVLPHADLADLELALVGVLPVAHVLGGPLRPVERDVTGQVTADPHVGVRLDRQLAERVGMAGSLLLVDEEQTPLGRLDVLETSAGPDDTVIAFGSLHPERPRESGADRGLALDLGPDRARQDLVVVIRRPPLRRDVDVLADAVAALVPGPARVLFVVPDHHSDTGGVPTHLMTVLAERLGARLASRASIATPQVATAPMARRGGGGDLVLVASLAAHLGAQGHLLSDDPSDDPAAGAHLDVLRQLREEGITGVSLAEVEDIRLLRQWRRPPASTGLVVMFTGLSGSGKSTIARALHHRILMSGQRTVSLLDGDVVRQMLSSGLGFDRAGRALNIRRIAFVAAEIARHRGVALCAPVAPFADTRLEARARAEAVGDFFLIHVSTPLEECERRDLKGHYAKARQGLIPAFTGISAPYEAPTDADLTIDTTHIATVDAVETIVAALVTGGWLEEMPGSTVVSHPPRGEVLPDGGVSP